MKRMSNIYGHGMVVHVKFHQGVIGFRGVIALCLYLNDFFHPQP